jgi:hypothetical protein
MEIDNVIQRYGDEIKSLYLQGESIVYIHKKLNLSRYMVREIALVHFGLTKHFRKVHALKDRNYKGKTERIIHLYRWGYEPDEIRYDVKMPETKIWEVIKDAGEITRITDSGN